MVVQGTVAGVVGAGDVCCGETSVLLYTEGTVETTDPLVTKT